MHQSRSSSYPVSTLYPGRVLRQSHGDLLDLGQCPSSRFHAVRAEVVHFLVEMTKQDLPEAVHDLTQRRGRIGVGVGERGFQERIVLVQACLSAHVAAVSSDPPSCIA